MCTCVNLKCRKSTLGLKDQNIASSTGNYYFYQDKKKLLIIVRGFIYYTCTYNLIYVNIMYIFCELTPINSFPPWSIYSWAVHEDLFTNKPPMRFILWSVGCTVQVSDYSHWCTVLQSTLIGELCYRILSFVYCITEYSHWCTVLQSTLIGELCYRVH